MRIVIAGGSLGGLFTAGLLGRDGHEVAIYERSRDGLLGRGAGLVAQPEVAAVLTALDCRDALEVGVQDADS